jgi:hypothetical protein
VQHEGEAMTPEHRLEIVRACAFEFILRENLVLMKEPLFNMEVYKSQFCHERCIELEELNLALAELDNIRP